MKRGLYTARSRYWLGRNILTQEPEILYLESVSLASSLCLKNNALQKICHLMADCQMIFGRNMESGMSYAYMWKN